MAQAPSIDRDIEALLELERDPVSFVRGVLGATLYDRQEEILASLVGARRVVVTSGNQVGKDWLNGQTIAWWMTTRSPAVCVFSGPTQRQVDIVWRECQKAIAGAKFPLGGNPQEIPFWKFAPDQYAIGFSTDRPYNIQGHHSPHLLLLITEAHGVSDEHFTAMERLGPELIIATGNPLMMQGWYRNAFHEMRDMWVTHTIDAEETPNVKQKRIVIPGLVTWEDVQDRRKEWGQESQTYLAAVKGQWPTSLEDAVLSLVEVMAAVKRDPVVPGQPNVWGLDIARGGADKTVLFHRRGLDAKLAWKMQGEQCRNGMQLVGKVAAGYADWNKQHRTDQIERIVIDDVGAYGVADRLRELGLPVIKFMSQAKPSRPVGTRYMNAATECWLLMADAIRTGGLVIPNDQALIGQLVSRRVTRRSDMKLEIESKEDLRPKDLVARSTWRSPDEADALAMTFWNAQLEEPKDSNASAEFQWS